jgi:hypothetical protein
MAAPSYTEDLTDIATGDEAVGWVELTGTGAGDGETYNAQGVPAYQDGDYPFIQGSYSVTQDCSKNTAIGSLAYNATITIPTDGAVFIWQNYMVASNIYNYATGGFRICLGSSLTDFDIFFVGGVDKSPYPYGGWDCQVTNDTVTPDDTAGTPTGVINYIGGAVYVVTGSSKGEVHNVDVMRYGRGSAIFTNGDLGNGYATISGFAAVNDTNANRWGLIQETSGGYLWQGRMLLGTDAAAVDFRDSNKNIFIKWTPKVTENFNLIEIQNIDSYVSMTGLIFQVLDVTTASRGKFLMSDPADVYLDQCAFVDMDSFIFDSTTDVNTVAITASTFRRCGEIIQGGATFNECSFNNSDSTTTIQVDNLNLISDCNFLSDGSNHAMELDSNHAGGSFTLLNCTYDSYAPSNGSTGNEVIYNNSGGHVTLNVSGGDVPTYRNGFGSTTTIVASVVWTFQIKNSNNEFVTGSEFRIYNSGTQIQVYGVETVTTGTEVYSFDQSLAGSNVDVVVHTVDEYLYFRQTLARPNSNATSVLVLSVDRWYDNPP